MDPEEELSHLVTSSWPELLPAGAGDRFRVACDGDAVAVLAHCREVLALILERSAGEWPSLEAWSGILPAWFTTACLDDSEVQNCVLDRWSLRGWLHWLRPENRRWFWWSAEVGAGQELTLTVLVPERPYLRGALDWLLTAAGAGGIEKL